MSVERLTLQLRQHRPLLMILLLAIVFRMGYALYLGPGVVSPENLSDQLSYHTLATRVLSGHGFSFPRSWYPAIPPDHATSFWSFGYVLYLAALYGIVGIYPLAARLIGALLGGLLTPWMIYRLAERLQATVPGFDTLHTKRSDRLILNLPLLSAFIAAVYFYFVLYAATLMTETFYILTVLWSLERAMALADAFRSGNRYMAPAIASGVALGVATLMRQSILPWLPFLFLWLVYVGWRNQRLVRAFKAVATITALLALFVVPFTIRNYRVYDSYLLLNSNTGYAMYSAQHPMHGTEFQEYAAAPYPQDLRGLNEAVADPILLRRAIGFILDDPGRYLLLSLSRAVAYFKFWPSPETTLLHNIGRVGSFGIFLPFMLYGIYLALRRHASARTRRLQSDSSDLGYQAPEASAGRQGMPSFGASTRRTPDLKPATARRSSLGACLSSPLALVLGFMLVYSLMHIFTWAMPRYRLPVDAVALPFAALAIQDVLGRLVARVRPGLPAPVAQASTTRKTVQ